MYMYTYMYYVHNSHILYMYVYTSIIYMCMYCMYCMCTSLNSLLKYCWILSTCTCTWMYTTCSNIYSVLLEIMIPAQFIIPRPLIVCRRDTVVVTLVSYMYLQIYSLSQLFLLILCLWNTCALEKEHTKHFWRLFFLWPFK